MDDPDGLHARPCTRVARAAEDYRSEVTLTCDGKTADARSVLALLGLGVISAADVEIRARGEDATACVDAIAGALQRRE
ncbi:MAG: HPr family phosphocarrier protein [Planctomycetes bacterium]|nr:HPr family phosphocarrier protein [Planctomycetota bacterium]